MTARNTWKNFERRLAYDIGGRRIPVTGVDRHGADMESEMFCFQAKLRSSIPSWLFDWLDGIVSTAKQTDRVGVLVMKTPGMEDGDALVVLRWRDWVDLHGKHGYDAQAHRARRSEKRKDGRA